MPANVDLAELKVRAREAADMVNSTYVEDSELTRYINASAQELYDLLIAAYGQEYYLSEDSIIVLNGVDTYNLPADFYKLLGVDLVLSASGNEAVTLHPYALSERNKFNNSYLTVSNSNGSVRARYRLQNNTIKIIPEPSGGYSLNILYIPAMTKFVAGVDTFDGVNGWEEYIVIDAAIKMLRKEESDISALTLEKKDMLERIESMAGSRDIGMSESVSDVSASQYELTNGIY